MNTIYLKSSVSIAQLGLYDQFLPVCLDSIFSSILLLCTNGTCEIKSVIFRCPSSLEATSLPIHRDVCLGNHVHVNGIITANCFRVLTVISTEHQLDSPNNLRFENKFKDNDYFLCLPSTLEHGVWFTETYSVSYTNNKTVT